MAFSYIFIFFRRLTLSLLCVSKVNNSAARFPPPPLSRTSLQLYHFPLDLCSCNFTDFPSTFRRCVAFTVSRSMSLSFSHYISSALLLSFVETPAHTHTHMRRFILATHFSRFIPLSFSSHCSLL